LRPVVEALVDRRYEEARAGAQRYLQGHQRDGHALLLVGLTYFRTDNFGAARPWLERALECAPELEGVHDHLGHTLFMLGDLDGSRRVFEAYEELEPSQPRTQYFLGLIDLEQSDLDGAARRFRRAIGLFEELGRADPQRGEQRLPELAECRARLADVHFALDDYESARDELLAATRSCPGNISAFYMLSLVYRRLGDEALADQAAGRYESAKQAILEGRAGRR
jgi:tetratricopeptide (TPR) repeat protein